MMMISCCFWRLIQWVLYGCCALVGPWLLGSDSLASFARDRIKSSSQRLRTKHYNIMNKWRKRRTKHTHTQTSLIKTKTKKKIVPVVQETNVCLKVAFSQRTSEFWSERCLTTKPSRRPKPCRCAVECFHVENKIYEQYNNNNKYSFNRKQKRPTIHWSSTQTVNVYILRILYLFVFSWNRRHVLKKKKQWHDLTNVVIIGPPEVHFNVKWVGDLNWGGRHQPIELSRLLSE